MTLVDSAAVARPTAEKWFEVPIQSIKITPIGQFSNTADGACQAAMEDGGLAYVKPRPDAARNLVVAREKIAADLAWLLGLPVAPVVVRPPDPAGGWNHYSALSLSCLKGGRLWASGGEAHLALAGPTLEALRVFWTWIGDNDHNAHGQNLLYEVTDGGCDVIAIDHSYSLCHGNAADPLAVGASQGYATAGRPDCQISTRLTVTKILSLEWAKVENIVRRLNAILTAEEQDRILTILKKRREQLATFLGLKEQDDANAQ